MQINRTETKKLADYKYLGRTVAMENRTRQRTNSSNGKQNKATSSNKNKSRMECFWKVQRNLSGQAPSDGSKRKVFNQCVLLVMTYGCQTWSLTKALVKILETSLRKENAKCQIEDRIFSTIIRQRTKVTGIVQYVTNVKWKWAGHITRIKNKRWTVKSTEWQIKGIRSVGRPKHR